MSDDELRQLRQRVEQLAIAVDRATGLAAGAAAYVAAMPITSRVAVELAEKAANVLGNVQKMAISEQCESPAQQAKNCVNRISDQAKILR